MIVCERGGGWGRKWDRTIKAAGISGNTASVLCETGVKREHR